MESNTQQPKEPREPREPRQHEGPENEIRVSFKTDVLRAVERVAAAFEKHEDVRLSAINSGISKLILIVEISKIKIEGLHQYNSIETLTKESKDNEGHEQRLQYLTAFKIQLWKNKPKTAPAGHLYQAPYSAEHIKQVREVKTEERDEEGGFRGGRGRGRGRGRGGFRGGRGGLREGSTDYRGGRGGRGRGRGRGFDGEGRGGRGRDFEGRGGRGRDFEGRGGRGGRGRDFESRPRRGSASDRGRGGHGRGGQQPTPRTTIPGLGRR
jgi:hypothetical protein